MQLAAEQTIREALKQVQTGSCTKTVFRFLQGKSVELRKAASLELLESVSAGIIAHWRVDGNRMYICKKISLCVRRCPKAADRGHGP